MRKSPLYCATSGWQVTERLACCVQPADGGLQAPVADGKLHAVLEVHCASPTPRCQLPYLWHCVQLPAQVKSGRMMPPEGAW